MTRADLLFLARGLGYGVLLALAVIALLAWLGIE